MSTNRESTSNNMSPGFAGEIDCVSAVDDNSGKMALGQMTDDLKVQIGCLVLSG